MEQHNFGNPGNMLQLLNIQELDLSSSTFDDLPLDDDINNFFVGI